MEKKRTDQTVKITVIAAALVVVILILGTIWSICAPTSGI